MVLAVVMGIMSAAILLAEATLLLSKLDLSLFSILISSVKSDELLVQVCVLLHFYSVLTSMEWRDILLSYSSKLFRLTSKFLFNPDHFAFRHLLLYLWCICVSVHIIHFSKLGC